MAAINLAGFESSLVEIHQHRRSEDVANAILKTLVAASAVHYLSPKVALGRSHFPATDPFADRLSKPLRDPWPRLGDSISFHVEAEVGTRCNSLAHLVGQRRRASPASFLDLGLRPTGHSHASTACGGEQGLNATTDCAATTARRRSIARFSRNAFLSITISHGRATAPNRLFLEKNTSGAAPPRRDPCEVDVTPSDQLAQACRRAHARSCSTSQRAFPPNSGVSKPTRRRRVRSPGWCRL